MIICFIGTRAQLIKMAPVVLELERRAVPFHLVLTGQHKETMAQIMADFGIRARPEYLYQGREVTGIAHMGLWFCQTLWKCLREAGRFLPGRGGQDDVILVHGDTVSTLLGAVAGKLHGIRVAHIEAGLRSRNIFHPFPEELVRLAVSRLSDFAFCPGAWAAGNAVKYRSVCIDTHHNTLAEALAHVLAQPEERASAGPQLPQGFGIASIHRFENIFSKTRLLWVVGMIERAAQHHPLVFVLHPATRKRLARSGLLSRLEGNPNIRLMPRMGYVDFVRLMRQARFVITDGGGNQEELSYLGVPTLLMRKATERREGLGTTATLCGYDEAVLKDFLAALPAAAARTLPPTDPSPTRIIVDELAPYGT